MYYNRIQEQTKAKRLRVNKTLIDINLQRVMALILLPTYILFWKANNSSVVRGLGGQDLTLRSICKPKRRSSYLTDAFIEEV